MKFVLPARLSTRAPLWLCVLSLGLVCAAAPFNGQAPSNAPRVIDTRTVDVTQTVALTDVPAGAKQVRLWVPIPSDGPWQRVLDRRVVSASGTWTLARNAQAEGDFIVVDVQNPDGKPVSAVVQSIVERQGVVSSLAAPSRPVEPALFKAELDPKAPLMEVSPEVQKMADEACGTERDPARQAKLLMELVAKNADHYSKDPSKPKCGRGAAQDCMEQGGGCCTDLHSLFIALARARGIPARIQYGYRLLDAKAGAPYDPGYRCWAEVFIPDAGWVPTDIVAADGAPDTVPQKFGTLSATRVSLWQGRSFPLVPASKSGPVDTMICGWAEIDGKPVDVLPAADGTPSKLSRTVQFKVLDRVPKERLQALPE